MQGLWHLDGDAADATGNGHNGTESNITYPTSTCHFEGQACAEFNGTNAQITLAGAINLTSIDSATVAFWAENDEVKAGRIFSDPVNDLIITAVTAGTQYRWFSKTPDAVDTNGGDSSTGSWKFVVMIYDGALKYIYIDNILVTTSTDLGNFGNSDTFRFGSQGAGEWYHGRIQEAFFATSAISPAVIAQLWNNGDGDILCTTAGCGGTPPPAATSTIQDAINYADFFIDFCALLGMGIMLVFKRRP